ncbi:MAG: hypothetical protein K9J13_14740 [Saprospiraceae bacterium]|nr:hypothetical protein [Saprospiraceae bacterium]
MKKVILYAIGSLLIVFIIGFLTHQYFYYKEYNSIKKELARNESIENFEIHVGNYDIEIEEIYADINFKDGNRITFTNLFYPQSFQETSYVEINRVNKWEFEINSFRESTLDYYILSSLRFGKHGQLNSSIEKSIQNVTEAINNRDEITDLVEKMPIYPKMAIIKHLDWHGRPTITFISKFEIENKPIWKHDKFENKFDSLLSVSIELKKAQLTLD